MKSKNYLKMLGVLGFLLTVSCEKSDSSEVPLTSENNVSLEILKQIEKLGYDTDNVVPYPTAEGMSYIVENDIVIPEEALDDPIVDGTILRIAETEQYHANLVPDYGAIIATRTGTTRYRSKIWVIMDPTLPNSYLTALQDACDRYNSIPDITFELRGYYEGQGPGRNGSHPPADIEIVDGDLPPGIYAGGWFPREENGEIIAHDLITMDPANINTNNNGFLTTLIAHEIGHCIGFRHTDWDDRSYSCGGGYDPEDANPVGAIHIPGTPASADAGSWMLACSANTTNRPFNANDLIAIDYLFTF